MDNSDTRNEKKELIKNRLSRIEGQVRGIGKMIDEGKSCVDILTQIAAARSAINKAGCLVMEMHSRECVRNAVSSGNDAEVFDELMNTLQKFMQFTD